MEQHDNDLMSAVLTADVIHPETRDVVAPAGARFGDALFALIDAGADCIETTIGTVTIREEWVQ